MISIKLLPACVGLASRGTLAVLSQVKLTNRTEKATTLIVHLPAYSTAGIVPFGACSQVGRHVRTAHRSLLTPPDTVPDYPTTGPRDGAAQLRQTLRTFGR